MAHRILVVDDDATLREVLRIVLTVEGFDVVEAPDGQAALERISDEHIDLVLSDVEMPRMGGVAMCCALKNEEKLVPVVLTTGGDTKPLRRWAGSGCQVPVLAKPCGFAALLRTIRERLGTSQTKACGFACSRGL